MNAAQKKKRPDNQLIGMAGEFLTAGQLLKRGYLASVTLGNAKAIDILVHNPNTGLNFNVQVKASQGRQGGFFFNKQGVHPEHIYVFVILNKPTKPEDFFIVKGDTILRDADKFFGKGEGKVSGVSYKSLIGYKDNWQLFGASVASVGVGS